MDEVHVEVAHLFLGHGFAGLLISVFLKLLVRCCGVVDAEKGHFLWNGLKAF